MMLYVQFKAVFVRCDSSGITHRYIAVQNAVVLLCSQAYVDISAVAADPRFDADEVTSAT
jgi:hypothetical protein